MFFLGQVFGSVLPPMVEGYGYWYWWERCVCAVESGFERVERGLGEGGERERRGGGEV